MKIKELIEKLQELNPDLEVFTVGYEGGYNIAGLREGDDEFVMDVNEEWYYGKHELLNDYKYKFTKDTLEESLKDKVIVKGIVIS